MFSDLGMKGKFVQAELTIPVFIIKKSRRISHGTLRLKLPYVMGRKPTPYYQWLFFHLNTLNRTGLAVAGVINAHLLAGVERSGYDFTRAVNDPRSSA